MCLCICPNVSSSSRPPHPHPSHIYPARPRPTSVIPVVECPWPLGLPPTSYSTRLSSTQFWDPRTIPSFPFPPLPLWALELSRPELGPHLPPSSSPFVPLPPEALGREEASPQSGKEATGTATGQQEGKEGCLCPCQGEVPYVFTQPHSRVDSLSTVNKKTLP